MTLAIAWFSNYDFENLIDIEESNDGGSNNGKRTNFTALAHWLMQMVESKIA